MSASGQGGKAAAKAHNVKSMLSHMISDASISTEEKAEQISQNVSKTTLFRKKVRLSSLVPSGRFGTLSS